jgi:predicted metalloprotease
MRFDNSRESSNVEDRRGGGGGGLPMGGKGIGLGTIVLALVAMYFGVDPSVVLNQAVEAPAPSAASRPAGRRPTMRSEVRPPRAGRDRGYLAADLPPERQAVRGADPGAVLRATRTACGVGQAAMGPFYCPADQKVYIDLAFYQELKTASRRRAISPRPT